MSLRYFEDFRAGDAVDLGSYEFWKERTVDVWKECEDKHPNQFMDRKGNAQSMLAEQLKAEHDSESEHPVFAAADGTVYADLLNAALSEVNWHEIAESLLSEAELEDYDNEPKEIA